MLVPMDLTQAEVRPVGKESLTSGFLGNFHRFQPTLVHQLKGLRGQRLLSTGGQTCDGHDPRW
jgi:hypothetical protein